MPNRPRQIAKTLEEAAQFQLHDSLLISSLQNEVNDIKEYMGDFAQELSEIKTDTAKILSYLQDDDKTNHKGLVHVTADNSERIDNLERFKTVFVGKVSTITAIGGGLAGLISTAIINYISKS